VQWQEFRSTMLIALAWALALLLFAVIAAFAFQSVSGMQFEAMLLALAPGGTAEMIIITYAVGGPVPFVSVCQVLRIFMIMTFAPIFARFVVGSRKQE